MVEPSRLNRTRVQDRGRSVIRHDFVPSTCPAGGDGQVAGTSFRQRVDQIVHGQPVRRRRRRRRRGGRQARAAPEEHVEQLHKRDDEVDGDDADAGPATAGRRVLQRGVRVGQEPSGSRGLAARQTARSPETGSAKEYGGGNGGARQERRRRVGNVAAVQLGPAPGPGLRDDQRKAVRPERRRRRRRPSRTASPQRTRTGTGRPLEWAAMRLGEIFEEQK